jgi:hypothetical protein
VTTSDVLSDTSNSFVVFDGALAAGTIEHPGANVTGPGLA